MSRRNGAMPPNCAPLLLSTAALLDFTLLFVLTLSILPKVSVYLDLIPREFHGLAVFGALVLISWFITEVLLGGRSFGRFVLGLELCDAEGKPLSRSRRIARGLHKISTLGAVGANPVKQAGYDRVIGAVWHAPMAPRKTAPLGEWRLVFKSGTLKGKASRLAAIKSFKTRGEIRFGRDKAWSDVGFGAQDVTVSGQHCTLFANKGFLFLRDGNEAGKPSTHGTFIAGRKLGPCETRPLGSATQFSIADITVEIRR